MTFYLFLFVPLMEGPPFDVPLIEGVQGEGIRIARGAIPTTTTSGAPRHLRQRRTH